MNCREFERALQAILDDRSGGAAAEPLADHAASCPACRCLWEKFRALQLALKTWTPPTPPPGLVDSVLARLEEPEAIPTPTLIPFPARHLRLAASIAAALLIAAVGLWAVRNQQGREPAGPGPVQLAQAPRPLADSLAEATTATLDLARSTSAPAARLGRLVFETASVPAEDPPSPEDPDAAGGVIRAVGDRVASGVRPISGTARRAFSFIIPSGPAGPRPSPNAGRQRGV